jgi:hypothetical protein
VTQRAVLVVDMGLVTTLGGSPLEDVVLCRASPSTQGYLLEMQIFLEIFGYSHCCLPPLPSSGSLLIFHVSHLIFYVTYCFPSSLSSSSFFGRLLIKRKFHDF